MACVMGNIRLVEDLQTGLVYNNAFEPALMDYDENYQNEQSASPLFKSHLEVVAAIIDRTIGKKGLVEVGCGKGYFLEMLLSKNFDVTGFDPAYEGENVRIKKQYFVPGGLEQADGLILRHVLEHIENPVGFLENLKDANGGRGKVYIEVPCFDWVCNNRAWFDIFYEHVNYFRLSDFRRMFGEVIEIGKIFYNQYLYLVAELSSLRKPTIDVGDRVNFPSDFVDRIRAQCSPTQPRMAIWGGASKGVIFSLLRARAGCPVSTVIDINPAKQGRFIAATGLQVKSPVEGLAALDKGSTIYVMNSNYLEEIKKMSNYSFNYIGVDYE